MPRKEAGEDAQESARRYGAWVRRQMGERAPRWDRRELMRRSGLDRTTVSRILGGGMVNPTVAQVVGLARAFDASPNEILSGTGYWSGEAGNGQGRHYVAEALHHARQVTAQLERYLDQSGDQGREVEIVPEPGDRLAALDREPPEPREGDDWNPA